MFLRYFILLIISINVSFSDEAVTFYVPGVIGDTVDFGMRYFENDVIIKEFIYENNTDTTFYVGINFPTYATAIGPSGNDTHLAFEKPDDDNVPITIAPRSHIKRSIRFFPNNGIPLAQLIGNYDATFFVGVSSNQNELNNLEFISYSKTFTLIGRVTNQDFDIWDTKIDFDSVFIDSPREVVSRINFRNNSENLDIRVDSLDFEIITSVPSTPELEIEETDFPIILQARSAEPGNDTESLEVSYKPVNRGVDSAIIQIYSSVESDFRVNSATVSGIGVDQELSLINSNISFEKIDNEYIINLGEIPNRKDLLISGSLRNTGNIRFGLVSSSIPEGDFIGQVNTNNQNEHIRLNESFDFSATITPQNSGDIETEIRFESDAEDRNLGGYLEALHKYEKIKIKARAIEPLLSVGILDTLDFGTISGTEECVNKNSIEFILKNIGSGTLSVLNSFTTNPTLFDIEIDENTLLEGEETTARIIFRPSGNEIYREYVGDELIIITNMFEPNSSLRIPIKAIFVEPGTTNLFAENTTFKPGSVLNIPISVDGDRISFTSRFSSTLTFDPSILRFNSLITQNTASELAANSSFIDDSESGRISMSINSPTGQRFLNSDTLVILSFNTSLGSVLESNMVFDNPKFGDEDCESLVLVDNQVGVARVDSLCGLEEYINNFSNVQLRDVYPNPVSNVLYIECYSTTDEEVNLSIKDSFGNTIINRNESLIEGSNEIIQSLSNHPNGIYHLIITNNITTFSRKFLIIN